MGYGTVGSRLLEPRISAQMPRKVEVRSGSTPASPQDDMIDVTGLESLAEKLRLETTQNSPFLPLSLLARSFYQKDFARKP